MSRDVHSFRQSDLTKALKAAIQAGLSVARFEIDKGGKIDGLQAGFRGVMHGAQ